MLLRCGACSCPCVSLCRERAPTGWRSTPCAPTRDSPVVVFVVSHARQVVCPSRPVNLPPVTRAEWHPLRAHPGSRRLARHPAAEEVTTTDKDESTTPLSSLKVRASPAGRCSNHHALLEPLSEPLLAPIMPLLAVGGCVRRPPPVPRVTALIVSRRRTPQRGGGGAAARGRWRLAARGSAAASQWPHAVRRLGMRMP